MKKLIVILSLVIILSGCLKKEEFPTNSINKTNTPNTTQTPVPSQLNNGVPHYKLKETVKNRFRPEWIWDEKKQDYEDTGDLVRDPETGLFPQPEPFPEKLKGDAYWDGHLGLYLVFSIRIDHQTGIIIEDPFGRKILTEDEVPEYIFDENDSFDRKYLKYYEFVYKNYIIKTSQAYAELDIIQKERLTKEWFGLDIVDLPMLLDKLEEGAPSSYTMSMILLITNADVGIIPSSGEPYIYTYWVNAFNELTKFAQVDVENGRYNALGYLALPIIYNQLKSGDVSMLEYLPEIAKGLYDENLATDSWTINQWMTWFEQNEAIISSLQYTLDYKINMPWLEPIEDIPTQEPDVLIKCAIPGNTFRVFKDLTELYMEKSPDIKITFYTDGISNCIENYAKNEVDFVLVTRDLTDEENQLADFKLETFYRSGLAFIINNDNQVNDLSFEQVVGIYKKEITDWSELGGEKGDILLYSVNDRLMWSLASSFNFDDYEVKYETGPDSFMFCPELIVKEYPLGITGMLVGNLEEHPEVKAVSIDGVVPTYNNVKSGAYPYYYDTNFLIKSEVRDEVNDFIEFCTTDPEAINYLIDEGYIIP